MRPEAAQEIIDQIIEEEEGIRKALDSIPRDADIDIHKPSRSAAESADEGNFKQKQIVKSLVLKDSKEQLFCVLVPGNREIDMNKLSRHRPEPKLADPQTVEEETDFKVGGVSPFGHGLPTIIDKYVFGAEQVRASAGSQSIGVIISPAKLKQETEALEADVTSKL